MANLNDDTGSTLSDPPDSKLWATPLPLNSSRQESGPPSENEAIADHDAQILDDTAYDNDDEAVDGKPDELTRAHVAGNAHKLGPRNVEEDKNQDNGGEDQAPEQKDSGRAKVNVKEKSKISNKASKKPLAKSKNGAAEPRKETKRQQEIREKKEADEKERLKQEAAANLLKAAAEIEAEAEASNDDSSDSKDSDEADIVEKQPPKAPRKVTAKMKATAKKKATPVAPAPRKSSRTPAPQKAINQVRNDSDRRAAGLQQMTDSIAGLLGQSSTVWCEFVYYTTMYEGDDAGDAAEGRLARAFNRAKRTKKQRDDYANAKRQRNRE